MAVTLKAAADRKMQSSKFAAMFSMFRQRGPNGFHPVTRYYDPVKEERAERLERLRKEADRTDEPVFDRELMAGRIRHSWQRQSSDRSQLIRLVIIMGLVIVILYYLIMSFGLLERANG